MGWCHELGPQIQEGCNHPMQAGDGSCTCSECGAVCAGRFAACADVWARRSRGWDRRRESPALTPRRGGSATAGLEVARADIPPAGSDGRRWTEIERRLDDLRAEVVAMRRAAARPQMPPPELVLAEAVERQLTHLVEVLRDELRKAVAEERAVLAEQGAAIEQLRSQVGHVGRPTAIPGWVPPTNGRAPRTHPVKAKLSSGLYHLPGMAAYRRTVPDRCYGSARDAEADGFRAARR